MILFATFSMDLISASNSAFFYTHITFLKDKNLFYYISTYLQALKLSSDEKNKKKCIL